MEQKTDQIYLNVLYNLQSLRHIRKGDAVMELAKMHEGDNVALLVLVDTTAHMIYHTADFIYLMFPDLTFLGMTNKIKSEWMGSEEDMSPWI